LGLKFQKHLIARWLREPRRPVSILFLRDAKQTTDIAVNINVSILVAILIVCWFAYGYYSDWKLRRKDEQNLREAELTRYDDNIILRKKAKFDKELDENVDLPDGIRRRDAYIYRNLISPWFLSLTATTRYEETENRKIKDDFYTYIYELQQSHTSHFLADMAKNDADRQAHWAEADISKTKCQIIEDAFAAAVGQTAVEELNAVRSRSPVEDFDRAGTRMAPAGMRFTQMDELIPALSMEQKFEMYTKLANENDPEAMAKLGYCYGFGGPSAGRDRVAGYIWLSKAIDAGYEDAKRLRAIVEQSMTNDDVVKARDTLKSTTKQ
jgi:hypothetical protein